MYRINLAAVLLLCLLVTAAAAHDKKKSGADTIKGRYDVRRFGAVGDGVRDDTEAFIKAWDNACQTVNGVLLVPHGHTFLIESINFTGPCEPGFIFQLDGTITPPHEPESWPDDGKMSRRQWLIFYGLEEMTLQGKGLIDGRGHKWWELPCKPHRGPNGTTLKEQCYSPVAIKFLYSKNLKVQGIKIRDSPQFHFRFDHCKNVYIDSIRISSPADSPNTDGIHIENTQNVKIHNPVISNGDDCVSIGSGSHNVEITNMKCALGHGVSIGSLGKKNSRACVSNITVKDCEIKDADNGVRIKTWQGGSGSVSHITYDNIEMENVRYPILLDQFYCANKPCANQTSAVYLSNIEYSRIKGTYDNTKPAMRFACSESIPCTNITISDLELRPVDQDDDEPKPFCQNAYGQAQTDTIPSVSCLKTGFPKSISENDPDLCLLRSTRF